MLLPGGGEEGDLEVQCPNNEEPMETRGVQGEAFPLWRGGKKASHLWKARICFWNPSTWALPAPTVPLLLLEVSMLYRFWFLFARKQQIDVTMMFGAIDKNHTWTLLNIPQYWVTPELSVFAACNIVQNMESWQNALPPHPLSENEKKKEKSFFQL